MPKQLNTTSSTKAELVGMSDVMGLVLWTWRFLEAQGYRVSDNVVYQDNQSAMLLENHGHMSSSKQSDQIKHQNLRVAYWEHPETHL
jgi:hypothetical protein